jgi:aspartyl-tRNA(Asn)/glutamyl-tRNA(Gln) amidotransferase subunit A
MTTIELHTALREGQTSCVDVARSCLSQIDALDGRVGAYLGVDRDDVLRQAEAIDRKRAAGETLGALAGLPVTIKDNICIRGAKTTCASRILENFSAPYDAHVIERIRAADGVLLGRANLDEFAMGSSCENSAFQKTFNPWDLERAPGGSSGGSAAAVAAGMSPLAIGSDTGGSIRQPASYCGIVGMKPTYGRVSRYGLVAFASSLDQIGPFARDVYGAALLLEVLAGHDPRDTTSIAAPAPQLTTSLDQPLAGLRIGLAREHFALGLDAEVEATVRTAADVYRSLGAEIKEISLPYVQYAVATYYVVSSSEASSNLARFDGVHYGHRAEQYSDLIDMYYASRGEGFGDEVKRRIMLGAYTLSSGYYDAYYLKALKVRRLVRQDFDDAFKQIDVIASPVAPTPAFKIGEHAGDPLAMYLQDIYTLTANLAGLPAISIPCGFSNGGLPIGLQLTAAPLQEERLLRAARMHERETDWHLRRPAMCLKSDNGV